jgi:hypothetical protein
MFAEKSGDSQPLTNQLDKINRNKRKITIESQHFEKISKITKNPLELRDMEKRVMESRQKFLQFGLKHF